jgi:hypothetical protein
MYRKGGLPTFGRLGKYKIKIYGRDHNPPHVHFEAKGASVRVNLVDLEIMSIVGRPTAKEIRLILIYVETFRADLIEVWDEVQTKN